MSKIVGIDLGTTHSLVSIIKDGKPVVIPDKAGSVMVPSVVGVAPSGKLLVGSEAKSQRVMYPELTIASIKRRMGEEIELSLQNKKFSPEEISSLILKKLKDMAGMYLGEEIDKAVITVPAYFDDRQRQATKKAGELAGFEVVRIINEPTAASLAYGLDKDSPHTVMVWDLGGGTFDISILEIGGGVIEVKSTSGDTHLGGDDWDQYLFDYLSCKIETQYGKEALSLPTLRAKLLFNCEKAKCELSIKNKTVMNQPSACEGEKILKNFKYEITREEFNSVTQDLFERLLPPVKMALSDAKLFPEDIDRIVLVGGATRMVRVRELVREVMGKEPYTDVNPDEVVALGAGLQAAMIAQEMTGMTLLDVTSLSLGIETQGGVFTKLIERNTPIPTSQGKIFVTAYDNQTSFDIHVLQGEREFARYNRSLGRFQLEDLSAAPRGEVKTEVTFSIDINGILHVSAQDLGSGEEKKISLKTLKSLSDQEIENILLEAKQYLEQDKGERKLKELSLKAQGMIYATEKIVENYKGRLSTPILENITTLLLELKEALQNPLQETIEMKMKNLSEIMEKAHEEHQKNDEKNKYLHSTY